MTTLLINFPFDSSYFQYHPTNPIVMIAVLVVPLFLSILLFEFICYKSKIQAKRDFCPVEFSATEENPTEINLAIPMPLASPLSFKAKLLLFTIITILVLSGIDPLSGIFSNGYY